MRVSKPLILMVTGLVVAAAVFAKDDKPAAEGQMPEMGPPKEIKNCAWLIGTWDAAAQMRMSPDAEFAPGTAVATYEYILDGSAIAMTYVQPMGGMEFKGYGVETFDRETGKWQMTWLDNMSARQEMFVGDRKGSGTVMTSEGSYQGKPMWNRISTMNETPTSFDWMGEASMDGGATWYTWGKASYKKRK